MWTDTYWTQKAVLRFSAFKQDDIFYEDCDGSHYEGHEEVHMDIISSTV